MGGAGLLLLQEEPPLSVKTGDGRPTPQKQSQNELLLRPNKENLDTFGGCDVAKHAAEDYSHAGVPLIRFLDLAESQSVIEPAPKRMKLCTAAPKAFDVSSMTKHVADIVLALAGLGLIRGGKDPTQEERRLQAEAYGHLGFLVQKMCPQELVPQDAVDNLIRDLGLCKAERQEVKTFEEILKEFQPPSSVQTVDSGRAGMDATITERKTEDSDPRKYLLSASRLLQGANGSSDQLQSDLPSQRQLEGEAVPSEHEGGAGGSHAEFTQAIQDLLQPRYPPDYAFQAAYSRSFMNATMPCEMCKVAARETVNVLMCDTCEKLFHLRCLQSYLMTGIPKGDWHCPTCGKDSKEKTQAPKYGRVKAGFSFANASAMLRKSSAKGPSSVPKAKEVVCSVTEKTNMGVTGNVTPPAIQKLDDQAPDSSVSSEKIINPGNSGVGFTALLDSFSQEVHAGSKLENAGQAANHEPSSHPQTQTTTRSIMLRSQAGQSPTMVPLKPPHAHSLKVARGAAKTAQKSTQSKKVLDSHNAGCSQLEAGRGGNAEKASNSVDHSGSLDEPSSIGSGEEMDGDKLVKETDRFGIEWVGDVLQLIDGKRFYSACTVGGYLYRLQDCALFRPETPNVPPYIARLQGLWEEASSGAKWVRVNWCYYPADMAMLPGRPPNPEVHEVYESNHGDNNLVGTIQGQCLVLHPENYAKEMERRQDLLKRGSTGEGLVPVFLCRWLYDVATATFRPKSGAL